MTTTKEMDNIKIVVADDHPFSGAESSMLYPVLKCDSGSCLWKRNEGLSGK